MIDKWLWVGFVVSTAFEGLKVGGTTPVLGVTNLLLVAAFMAGLLNGKRLALRPWLWVAMCGFLGAVAVTWVAASDKAAHLAGSSVVMGGAMAFVASQTHRAYREESMSAYEWAASLTSTYAVSQYALWQLGIDLPGRIIVDSSWPYLRVSAWYADPNAMAFFLVPAVSMLAGQVAAGRFRAAPSLGLVGGALLLSRSRDAWLGSLAGLFSLALLLTWRRAGAGPRRWLRIALLPFSAAMLLVLAPVLAQIVTAVVALNPGSVQDRTEVWRVAWSTMVHNPGGVGLGNFVGAWSMRGQHNTYLTYFVELGVLGGTCFLLIAVGSVITQLRRGRSVADLFLGAALVSLAVSGFFLSTSHKVWWVMMGLTGESRLDTRTPRSSSIRRDNMGPSLTRVASRSGPGR